jgi:hypothetical protein
MAVDDVYVSALAGSEDIMPRFGRDKRFLVNVMVVANVVAVCSMLVYGHIHPNYSRTAP